MKQIFQLLITILSNRMLVLIGLSAISLIALISALIAEHIFGLAPCILCIYQRFPYLFILIVAMSGSISIYKKMNQNISLYCLLLCTAALFIEAIIAFYHVGVEQHWWKSFLEGCTIDFSIVKASLLEQIQSAKAVPCDEIPWQLFGISMAGYNVLLSLGLFVLCTLSLRFRWILDNKKAEKE